MKQAILLITILICGGCAAHNPPKVGAPPHTRYSTPFGSEQVCDGPYQYNPQTMKCERAAHRRAERGFKVTLVEIIGNQHLRILSLEETLGQLQVENSRLQEKIVQLTPKPEVELPALIEAAAAPAVESGTAPE